MKSLKDLIGKTGIQKRGLYFLILGIMVISFSLQGPSSAEAACAPLTGHLAIDDVCCVDPLTLSYTSPPQ